MSSLTPEFDELRVSLERLRAMLETLIVRGLRACGPEQLAQLKSYIEQFEQAGASHVATVLSELHDRIQGDDRSSAKALLKAQSSVRMLERLLTLRVVKFQFDAVLGDEDEDADNFDDDLDSDESEEA